MGGRRALVERPRIIAHHLRRIPQPSRLPKRSAGGSREERGGPLAENGVNTCGARALTGGPREDQGKTQGGPREEDGRKKEDHGGSREATGGPREDYCPETRRKANKSRVTPNSYPIIPPVIWPNNTVHRGSTGEARRITGGTQDNYPRSTGAHRRITVGARADPGIITGGPRRNTGVHGRNTGGLMP